MIEIYYYICPFLIKTVHHHEHAPLLLKSFHSLLTESELCIQVNSETKSVVTIKDFQNPSLYTIGTVADVYKKILTKNVYDATKLVSETGGGEEFLKLLRFGRYKKLIDSFNTGFD